MTGVEGAVESDAEFLTRLRRLAENWRYSDESIGSVVRDRWPRDYEDIGGGS